LNHHLNGSGPSPGSSYPSIERDKDKLLNDRHTPLVITERREIYSGIAASCQWHNCACAEPWLRCSDLCALPARRILMIVMNHDSRNLGCGGGGGGGGIGGRGGDGGRQAAAQQTSMMRLDSN